MLEVETVGSFLVSISKALKAAATNAPNKRIFCFAGLRLSDEGKFEADIVELHVKKRSSKPTGAA
jgi:hypothetical protein